MDSPGFEPEEDVPGCSLTPFAALPGLRLPGVQIRASCFSHATLALTSFAQSSREFSGLAGARSIRVPAEAMVERLPFLRGVEYLIGYAPSMKSRRICIFSRSVRSS